MTIFKLLRKADILTLANAAFGFLAITYISDGKYAQAMVLILMAVVADGADGMVARRFGTGKPSLGDYLDIMADYLSFCVAPSILLYQTRYDVAASPLLTRADDLLVGLAAGVLVGLGLLRLARHVALGGPASGRFVGLPTTAAGLFVTLVLAAGGLGDVLTSVLILVVGALMVTEIPYPKVRGPLAGAAGALVVAAAAALLLPPELADVRTALLLAALAGASAYAVSGPAFVLMRVPVGRRHAAPESALARRSAPAADSQEVDPDL